MADGKVAALAWVKREVPRKWPVPRRTKTQLRIVVLGTRGDIFDVISEEQNLALQQIWQVVDE